MTTYLSANKATPHQQELGQAIASIHTRFNHLRTLDDLVLPFMEEKRNDVRRGWGLCGY
jgi:hypothetical protein